MQGLLTRETLLNPNLVEGCSLPFSLQEAETLIDETIETLKDSGFPPLKLAGAANGVASVILTRGDSIGKEEVETEVYEDKLIDLLASNPDVTPGQIVEHAIVIRLMQHMLRS